MQFTATEEQLMQLLWKRKRAVMKELLEDFPEPKPAKTTVATLLKRMTDKGFINFDMDGAKRVYYPLIKKKDYSSSRVNKLIKGFFNNSAAQLASFCTTENNLTTEELNELKDIIDEQLKKQQS